MYFTYSYRVGQYILGSPVYPNLAACELKHFITATAIDDISMRTLDKKKTLFTVPTFQLTKSKYH